MAAIDMTQRLKFLGVTGNLTPLPGCPAIVVSHDVFVPEHMRHNGVGTQACRARIEQCNFLGWDVIMCTAREDNSAEIAILKKNDWKKVHSFKSSRNGAWIGVWLRNTNPYEGAS